MKNSPSIKFLLAGVAICFATATGNAAEPTGFSLKSPDQEQAAIAKQVPAAGSERLRHIAVDSGDMFFAGESGKHEYPFFALPAEVAAPATLVLTMQTAISAAPERSTMRVYINDVDVGTVELSSGDPRQIEFPVAGGVIQPGYNSVSILVDQKHRVDCSIDATYELWTQVDPEKSGFVFSRTASSTKGTIADLVAQGRGNDGRASLVAHVLPGASSADIDRTMSVIQALTILGDFDNPTITFDQNTSGTGIDIYVGTYGTVRELLNVDASSEDVMDGTSIRVSNDESRSKLIISARTAEELELHIKEFAGQLQDREITGTPQGLRALANAKGQMLEPASHVALRDLGFISKPFAGRLYRETINFSMPSDFYPADYASLGINLSAQYAAGLAKDAVLIVKANGQIVSNIQLGDGQTGVIRNQRLPIPLSKLRPGENSLTFEAQLPMQSDTSCDPVASLQEPPRFLIMDDTFLDMPSYARVGRYPDLASLVSGAEFAGRDAESKPLNVFVPKLDRQLLSVAGTFVAKMAYSAGHVVDIQTMATQPESATSPVLAFGTFASLNQAIQSEMKLDLTNIGVARFTPATTANEKNPKIERAVETTNISARLDALVQSSKDAVVSAVDWAKPRGQMHFAGWSWGAPNDQLGDEKVYRPLPGSDLLIAQRATDKGGVWTVVASPSADLMANSMAALSQRATWKRLNGATQAFSQTGALIDEQPASSETLFQTQPLSFTNLRLITAGWFANNSVEYTVAQILAALILGFSTFLMLKVGRRS